MLKKKKVLQLSHYLNKTTQISYLAFLGKEKKKKKSLESQQHHFGGAEVTLGAVLCPNS